jgi:Polyketide cyclase / dehydrase and lipid transport
MTEGTANGSAIIHAPAAHVYGIIADYRVHHPRIVPPEYFRKVEVEAGGVGAGTRIRVETRVLGRTQQFVHDIREPEPGRVLEEVDASGFSVTRFTVEPAEQGSSSRVTIATTFRGRSGPFGAIERAVTAATLRRIYKKELARLEQYATQLPLAKTSDPT